MFSRQFCVKQAANASSIPSYRPLGSSPIKQLRATPSILPRRTMASSSKVHLSPSQQPQFYLPGISSETADTTSQLLQENHEKHHIFFNQSGFHNHIVHHLLTLFALNASPTELKKGYKENLSYQRRMEPLEQSVVKDMHELDRYKTYLGNGEYYHEFLAFYQEEIAKKGWQNVLNEYVFKGDERADDMLCRMFAGFLHPIIHLGFGVEFEQPAIIAEALAQAAVHDAWMMPLFLGCEKMVKEKNPNRTPSTKSVVEILDEIRADKKLSEAPQWGDGNKIRDGLLKRVPDDMIKYASQYIVADEKELEEKTAEMINAIVYYTAAAQHPPHQVKIDFYYMHCVNCSIFFPVFLSQPWLSTPNKIRLLEWKVRNDLVMYASRRSPKLLISEIRDYKSKKNSEWQDVFARVKSFPDDGHASKLVRALANGQKICEMFEGRKGFVVEGDMWRILGNMAIDSVEAGEPHWVRSCGFEEAWRGVPEREQARL
ncbi:hypothetical protein CC78DRAFT_531046 [Lojkania enalia]|uniref:HypA-like protein n=1 Tax=Lojkania enalia TaxID=147567 RepID=A0A9P4KFZ0_9PLEO|nr:hypothetical protein CC78DRAFT_531046 [Didymosphaeria enalia]